MGKDTWDNQNQKYIEMPERMAKFIEEIEAVYKKHDMSVTHEDGHGSFIIEKFDERNVRSLKNATKGYVDKLPYKDQF